MNIRTTLSAVERNVNTFRRRICSQFLTSEHLRKVCTGRIEPLEPRIVLAVNIVPAVILDATIWAAGDVQRIGGDTQLPAGSSLTIEPGAIIQFDAGSADLVFAGTVTQSAGATRILFTSVNDDTGRDGVVGGGDDLDTGGNGASVGARGEWDTIRFASTSVANSLSNWDVRFGGGNGASGSVIFQTAITLADSSVRNSAGAGISIISSSPTITGTTIQNNTGPAVQTGFDSSPTISGVTLTGNGINGLFLTGGTLPTNAVWNNPDIPYQISFFTNVFIAQGSTLTISPGQIVKFENQGGGFIVHGSLVAVGTAAQPIILTSTTDDSAGGDTNGNGTATVPTPGGWSGIDLKSTSTGNQLEHVEVRYAGGSGSSVSAAVKVDHAPLILKDSVLRHSNGNGLKMVGASPTITDTVFRNNLGAAIRADVDSVPVISGATILNNLVNGLAVDDGTITSDRTWNHPDVVYWIETGVRVAAGAKLTIEPGQIVKFGDGGFTFDKSLFIRGTLDARGTAAQPIIFTSDSDDSVGGRTYAGTNPLIPTSGDWSGIRFTNTSTGNVMDHVEVRYGGLGGSYPAVWLQGAPLTLTNSVVRDSSSPHVRIEQSNPIISGSTFRGGFLAAMSMDLLSNPQITNSVLVDNTFNHLLLDSGTITGNAVWDDVGIVYEVDQINVAAGSTLTIEPGMVIKGFSYTGGPVGRPLVINGTLTAIGTAEQPIIFTSYYDDSAGGRTVLPFGDGTQAGVWSGLVFNATSTGSMLDHVEVRYAGGTSFNLPAAVKVDGSQVTIRNSRLLEARNDGLVAVNGAQVSLINSVVTGDAGTFGIRAEGGATTVTATNNTIDGMSRGVSVDAATVTLKNNLITNNSTGVFANGGTVNASFNNVFSAGVGHVRYQGPTDPTGSNGNISADPLYFNAESNQFRLRAQSPAIDAGTSDGALGTDNLGVARFDQPAVPNTGSGSGGAFFDMGAFEALLLDSSDVDLTTTSVTPGVATGLPGVSVGVSWTVKNLGDGTAFGPWLDGVYLSRDAVWTPDDILLKEVTRQTFVGPGLTYNASTNVTLPSVLPGNYHFIVRTNSGNDVFEGQTLGNNPGASTATIAMDLPALMIDTPSLGQIDATGQARYFKVTVPAGEDLSVKIDGPAGATNELYLRFGDLPSRQLFDARGVRSDDQTISVANTLGGDYYVMVFGANVPPFENFTLLATTPEFSISGVGPERGSNTGQVTLSIRGAHFDLNTEPRLIDSAGDPVPLLRTYFADSGLISATFDLNGSAVGPAVVQVSDGGSLLENLNGGFEIVAGAAGRLVTNLISPTAVRTNRDFTLYLEFTNAGDTDLLAPVVGITNSGPDLLSVYADRHDSAQTLNLIGTGASFPGGVLPPGTTTRLPLYSHAGNTAGSDNFSTFIAAYPAVTIDWAGISPLIRPDGLPDAVWTPLFAKIQQNIGDTWDDFARVVANDATLLPASLGSNTLLSDVLQLEYDKAFADVNTSVSGRVFLRDTLHPAGNVEVQIYDSVAGEAFHTYSLNDGTFLLPFVEPGTYQISLPGYLSIGISQIVVGTSDPAPVDLTVEPGGVISGGVVLTTGGVPLRDLLVSVESPTGGVFSTTTDHLGRFRVEGLPSGDYTVRAGGTAYSESAVDVTGLVAGTERAQVTLALHPGASISGVVSGAGGPLVGATVIAIGDDEHAVGAVSGLNGTFTIVGLGPQNYRVRASSTGLVNGEISGIGLEEAEHETGANVSLTLGGTLSGEVTAPGGAALPFLPLSFSNGADIFSAQTNQDGKYRIDDLPPGTYTVTPLGLDNMSVSFMANVIAGDGTTLNLVSPPLGDVHGVVMNTASGQPLAGVTVFATAADGLLVSDVTDTMGAYFLDDLDAGTYSIVLGDPGTPGIQRMDVAVTPAASSVTQNFSVAVAGVIAGTVFQTDGTTPFPDAVVKLVKGSDFVLTQLADDSGNYSFVVLVGGSYGVVASANGLTFPSNTATVGAGEVHDRDFVAGARSLFGTIREGGTPIAGASIFVFRTDAGAATSLVAELTSAANGTFNLAGLADGSYRVRASATGLAFDTEEVVIAGADPAPLFLDLSVEGTLHGAITDAQSGLPLASAIVTLVSRTPTPLKLAIQTGVQGEVDFTNLPAGTYDVIVVADDHRSYVGSTVIAAGANSVALGLSANSTLVEGRVTGAAGSLEGVLITAVDANGFTLGAAFTDATGDFAIETLPPGAYTLRALAQGYQPAPLAVSLAAGEMASGRDFSLVATALTDPVDESSAAPVAPGVVAPSDPILDDETPSRYVNYLNRSISNPNPLRLTLADLQPLILAADCVDKEAKINRALREVTKVQLDFKALNKEKEKLVADGDLLRSSQDNFGIMGKYANLNRDRELLRLTVQTDVGGGVLSDVYTDAIVKLNDLIGTINVEKQFLAQSELNSDATAASSTVVQAVTVAGAAARMSLLQLLEKANQSLTSFQIDSGASDAPEIVKNLTRLIDAATALITSTTALQSAVSAQDALVRKLAKFGTQRSIYELTVGQAVEAVLILEACGPAKNPNQPHEPPKIDSFGGPETTPSSTNQAPPNAAPETNPGPTSSTRKGRDRDPNLKTGPAGFGTAGFIQPGVLEYLVEFENASDATANAQIVIVTDTLDADLDLASFEFTSFGFGAFKFDVPAGLSHYTEILDLRPDGIDLLVPVTLDLDLATRVVSVVFTSLDPQTMLEPDGVDEGFLPPNVTKPEGQGFFTYVVSPSDGLPTGTEITNFASIVFGDNDPIVTPTTLNTLDADAPTSGITTAPATQARAGITLNFQSADIGSGLAGVDVFVSDGGPFQLALSNVAGSTATFVGKPGHTYGFFSLARDQVGNLEPMKTVAETTFTLAPSEIVTLKKDNPKLTFTDDDGTAVKVTLSGAGTATIERFKAANGQGDIYGIDITGSDAKSKLTVTPTKGNTTLATVEAATPLSALSMQGVHVLDHIKLTGAVSTVTLGSLVAGADVTLMGTAAKGAKVAVGDVTGDSSLTSAGPLASLQAVRWLDGAIAATSLGKLTIAGAKKPAVIAGDFGADLTLTDAAPKLTLGPTKIVGAITGGDWNITGNAGMISALSTAASWTAAFTGNIGTIKTAGDASGQITAKSIKTFTVGASLTGAAITLTQAVVPATPKLEALHMLKITGLLDASTIRSAGHIGSVTAGALRDSSILAGVNAATLELPAAIGDFDAAASIAKVTIKGIKGVANAVVNSSIAAQILGSVTLRDLLADNTNTDFGVAADRIAALTIYEGKTVQDKLTKLDTPAGEAVRHDDFVARVI